MIKIREGMFETNSSSCHAIVVVKKASQLFERGHVEGNKLIYTNLEFGCDYDVMTGWVDKLGYVIANKCEVLTKDEIEDYLADCVEMVQRHYPEIEKIVVPMSDDEFDGGINYQSRDLLDQTVDKENIDSMEEFVFDDKYVLIIAWDSSPYEDYVEAVKAMGYEPIRLHVPWATYDVKDGKVDYSDED